jgi:hypothetical protein
MTKTTARRSVTTGGSHKDPPEVFGLDRRTKLYRGYAAVLGALAVDQGGADALSEGRRQLIARAAFLAARLAMIEADALSGAEIDIEVHGRASERLRRMLTTIGLDRVPREVESLSQYLDRKAAVKTETTP